MSGYRGSPALANRGFVRSVRVRTGIVQENRRAASNKMNGIGGSLDYYIEPALVAFTDSDTGDFLYSFIDVLICGETTSSLIKRLPSLLGRDFLNQCSYRIDLSSNQVIMQPINVQTNGVITPLPPPTIALPTATSSP